MKSSKTPFTNSELNNNRTLNIKYLYQTKVRSTLVNVCNHSSLHSISILDNHASIFQMQRIIFIYFPCKSTIILCLQILKQIGIMTKYQFKFTLKPCTSLHVWDSLSSLLIQSTMLWIGLKFSLHHVVFYLQYPQ